MKILKYISVYLVLLTFSLETIYAESILIEGGVENIVFLANTEYIAGTPVIFFSEQLKGRTVEIIDKVDVIIVTGDDPDFFNTDFLKKATAKKTKVIYMIKSKEEMERTSERLDLKEFNLLKKKPIEKISIYRKENQKTILEYKKINPTRYLINVKTSESFWLVFSESFHEGWKAYVRKETEDREKKAKENREPWSALISALKDKENRIELKDHFIANGYANSWWMPVEIDSLQVKSNTRSFEIILEFKQQRLFEIGVFISLVTLICCLSYLFFYGMKRIRLKKTGKS